MSSHYCSQSPHSKLTFHNFLVLFVSLGGLLSELLIPEDAEVPDGAPGLALSNHLLENLCEKMESRKKSIWKIHETKCQPVFCWVTNIFALQG